MTAPAAEWLLYAGQKHAWHPAEDGARTSWCAGQPGSTVPDRVLVDQLAEVPEQPYGVETPVAPTCMPCALSHGAAAAAHHGANVHRAPDPEGVQ